MVRHHIKSAFEKKKFFNIFFSKIIGKVLIATNTNRNSMTIYMEVIDLVNPQFQRKFIERRLEYTDIIDAQWRPVDAEAGGGVLIK